VVVATSSEGFLVVTSSVRYCCASLPHVDMVCRISTEFDRCKNIISDAFRIGLSFSRPLVLILMFLKLKMGALSLGTCTPYMNFNGIPLLTYDPDQERRRKIEYNAGLTREAARRLSSQALIEMSSGRQYRGSLDDGIRHFTSRSSALQHVRVCINIPQWRVHYTNPLVYSTLPGWPDSQYIILSLNKETDLATVNGVDSKTSEGISLLRIT